MPSLAGPLAEGVLPGVLRSLYTERRTGLLHASRGAERASVCFVGGNIVYGSTTIKECRLGETLVRHGILRQHDRERAGSLVAQTGQRLGQILLDLGLLDADGLQDALALQVREVLLSVLSWRDGAYEFEAQDAGNFRGFDKPLPLSTGEVILDAVWSIVDPDVIRYALGDLDRVLTPASDPLLRFQSIALSPTDGFILSRVDGASSAREILALVPADALDVERSLCGLLYTGMVEFVKAPAPRPSASVASSPARLAVLTAHLASPGQDHYQVLGVSREATSAELLAAYFRLAKAYHPDQHHRPGLQDLEDVLQDLFIRVGEAHRCLSNARARADYDRAAGPARSAPPTPPAPVAPAAAEEQPAADASGASVDEAIEKAEAALAAGRILDVFVALDGVLPQARGRVRRRGRLLKAQAHLRVADGSKAAEDELKAALEEDAAHPEAHYLLGTIYRDGGAPALAASEFRKALGLKPRYPEAQAALLGLGPPAEPPTEAGRLFRRLTGR